MAQILFDLVQAVAAGITHPPINQQPGSRFLPGTLFSKLMY